jgi:hypothetical protein
VQELVGTTWELFENLIKNPSLADLIGVFNTLLCKDEATERNPKEYS